MMEQVFVERQPQRGAKFLSTFGTNCVSASITQHGPGIIKLAVDVAYELLAQVRVLTTTSHNINPHLFSQMMFYLSTKYNPEIPTLY